LTQKHLIANEILQVPSDAIFIQTEVRKENFKNKARLWQEEEMTCARMINECFS